MSTSNTPTDVAYPAIPVNNSSSSCSSDRAHAVPPAGDGPPRDTCAPIHAAEAFVDRRCSTSSQAELETARINVYDISEDGRAGLDHGIIERIHDQDRRHDPDSSGFSVDVEKGWNSGNAAQMNTDEDGLEEYCRVCHLTVERSPSAGEIITLGCACKDDLALAHRRCAEAWFRIRGNTTCEICGSVAQNVGNSGGNGEGQPNDMEGTSGDSGYIERCWRTQPLCNTLIVCLILVLIASWLFRVTLF